MKEQRTTLNQMLFFTQITYKRKMNPNQNCSTDWNPKILEF